MGRGKGLVVGGRNDDMVQGLVKRVQGSLYEIIQEFGCEISWPFGKVTQSRSQETE